MSQEQSQVDQQTQTESTATEPLDPQESMFAGRRRPARPKEHHAQDPEGCCHPQTRQWLVMRFMYGCQACDVCHAQKVSLLTIVRQKIVLSHGN